MKNPKDNVRRIFGVANAILGVFARLYAPNRILGNSTVSNSAYYFKQEHEFDHFQFPMTLF